MLHDLTIRTIAEYLVGENQSLVNLERLSARFYSLRDIFISNIEAATGYSYDEYFGNIAEKAYRKKPYGWNKVKSFTVAFKERYIDLSLFSNMHTLIINNCKIKDVTLLANIKNLTIRLCPELIDISPLANVPRLSLLYCPGIMKVAPLSHVRDLTIDGCMHITDLAFLGTVRRLKLYNLNMEDLSPFTQVKSLILKHCYCPNGYEALAQMKNLIMIDCRSD